MSAFEQALRKFQEFKNAFEHETAGAENSERLLSELKVLMTQFSFLHPGAIETPNAIKEMLLARETLELATLLSVKTKNLSSFERHIAQVKTYYQDTGNKLEESPRQYSILGLNLLRLLATNRIAEFHTELELIPADKHDNIFVRHPIQLEQYLMEGSYNKVLAARKEFPSPYYTYFMDILIDTVRDEIADCTEKAYTSLPSQAAKQFLIFQSDIELFDYAATRNWNVQGGEIIFEKEAESVAEIPAYKLMKNTLSYAKELERIV